MKNVAWLVFPLVLLAGCSLAPSSAVLPEPSAATGSQTPSSSTVNQPAIFFPIAGYNERLTFKVFGQYVHDRFTGYHVGDDIEYTDTEQVIPVRAMADGEIEIREWVSGYGGLVRIKHVIDGQVIHSLYGHIALSSVSLKVGDHIKAGQFLANLGKGYSTETDGERHHLHFAIYAGNDNRINGYEQSSTGVSRWINPQMFLAQHQAQASGSPS